MSELPLEILAALFRQRSKSASCWPWRPAWVLGFEVDSQSCCMVRHWTHVHTSVPFGHFPTFSTRRSRSDFEVDSRSRCMVRQRIHYPSHSLNDGIIRATNVIIVEKHRSVCGYGLHLPKVTHSAPCRRALIKVSRYRHLCFLNGDFNIITLDHITCTLCWPESRAWVQTLKTEPSIS